jgi:hypothetical protein
MAIPTYSGEATYPQFTNLKLQDGLVDQLLAVIKLHVKEEFDAQRITAADYSKVYLGALEAVLGNSTQFLLGTMLLDVQREKIQAEIKLIELEQDKLQFEIDYMYPAQLIKLEQEGILIASQVKLTDAKVLETEANIRKIDAEILMLESQKLLIDAQIDKINQEILFLQAKIKTEAANTENNFTADSLIGRQTALLKAQKLGFAGDLYIKQAKLYADYQAVWLGTIEDETATDLQGRASEYTAHDIAGDIASIP